MKKVLTLALVLIMGLVIFSGCNNINNPVEPESNSSSNLTKNSSNKCYYGVIQGNSYEIVEIDGNGYIVFEGEEVNVGTAVLANPHLKHYLVILKKFIEGEVILFKTEQMRIAYLNKIEVIEELIDNDHLAAAINKLNNDLLDKTEKWMIDEEQKELCKLNITLTDWMLNNPDQEFYQPCADGWEFYWNRPKVVDGIRKLCSGFSYTSEGDSFTVEYCKEDKEPVIAG